MLLAFFPFIFKDEGPTWRSAKLWKVPSGFIGAWIISIFPTSIPDHDVTDKCLQFYLKICFTRVKTFVYASSDLLHGLEVATRLFCESNPIYLNPGNSFPHPAWCLNLSDFISLKTKRCGTFLIHTFLRDVPKIRLFFYIFSTWTSLLRMFLTNFDIYLPWTSTEHGNAEHGNAIWTDLLFTHRGLLCQAFKPSIITKVEFYTGLIFQDTEGWFIRIHNSLGQVNAKLFVFVV